MDNEIVLVFILTSIVLIALTLFVVYLVIIRNTTNKQKKYRSMSEASIKNLELKKKKNTKILEEQGFNIYRELISPVEPVNGRDSIKVVVIDFVNFNMAITYISTNSEVILPKIYDIRNLTEVKLIVNDKEDKLEEKYESKITSIKLDIKAKDKYNPQYSIALLPKTVLNPDRKFDEDYLLYARAISKELNKVVSRNTL